MLRLESGWQRKKGKHEIFGNMKNESTNLPTNQPTHQATNPPSYQPTNLPTHQHVPTPTNTNQHLPTPTNTNQKPTNTNQHLCAFVMLFGLGVSRWDVIRFAAHARFWESRYTRNECERQVPPGQRLGVRREWMGGQMIRVQKEDSHSCREPWSSSLPRPKEKRRRGWRNSKALHEMWMLTSETRATWNRSSKDSPGSAGDV